MNCMGVKNSYELSEEDKRLQLFHIKVQAKRTRIDVLFDPGLQVNLITEDLVKDLELQTQPHTHPYSLKWMHKNARLKITR